MLKHFRRRGGLFVAVLNLIAVGVCMADHPAIVMSQFIYQTAPFPECHASTIVQTPEGLVAAWFGGTREKAPDVCIYAARHDGKAWSAPELVADGVQADGKRHPCWNPVLFQGRPGELVLFYKVGPSPSTWWGMRKVSTDHGRTWSAAVRLGKDVLGPIKNKPVLLGDGTLLCGSSTEHDGWRVHMERTRDLGDSAELVPVAADVGIHVIQPTILAWGDRLQILCRTDRKKIGSAWSDDGGRSWSKLDLIDLPNPNAGIDAVSLKDGRAMLVFNNTPTGRSPLSLAVSADGKAWKTLLDLETASGEYSYPAIIQASDGLVHVTYTWKRQRIRHVVIDPAKLPS